MGKITHTERHASDTPSEIIHFTCFLISVCSKLDYILWAGLWGWVDNKTNNTTNEAHLYINLKLLIHKISDCIVCLQMWEMGWRI